MPVITRLVLQTLSRLIQSEWVTAYRQLIQRDNYYFTRKAGGLFKISEGAGLGYHQMWTAGLSKASLSSTDR